MILLHLLLLLPPTRRRVGERARGRGGSGELPRAAAAVAEKGDEVAPRRGGRGGRGLGAAVLMVVRSRRLAGLDQAVEQVLAAGERLRRGEREKEGRKEEERGG